MLEVRQTKIAAAIEARRDEVARVRGQLVDRRDQFAAVRSDKATALASTRDSRKHLEGDLAALEAANAKIQAQLAAAQNGTAPGAAGPIRPGAGGLIWPVNGPIVSPFGMRWGRLHAGVDIAVPVGHADPRREGRQGPILRAGPAATATTPASATAAGSRPVTAHQSSYGTSIGANVIAGPGHRLRRLHRPLLRRPPALRDAHQRRAGQPGGLPVARRVP